MYICIYIYIYSDICLRVIFPGTSTSSLLPPTTREGDLDGGFYFVCDHGKHRNAKAFGATFGAKMFRGAKRKLHPNRTV